MAEQLIGSILSNRYRIDSLLGEGAMGRVYEAEHVLMHKRVAIKVLHRELTQVPEIVRRFEREALAASRVQHPHIAAATDFGALEDGSFFLVLEHVQGQPLDSLLTRGPVAPERVLGIGLQIAAAVNAAHEHGIVHRDLKPENILLIDRGEAGDFIKVLDFGIAKIPPESTAEGQSITQVGMVYGTPEYMAPEQALGQEVDFRADLYALGVVLYELLAGRRPYIGPTVGLLGQQLTKPLPLIEDVAKNVKVPAHFERLVREMLATDKEKRPANMKLVLDRLDELEQARKAGKLYDGTNSSKLFSLTFDEITEAIARATQTLPTPMGQATRRRTAHVVILGGVSLILGMAAVTTFQLSLGQSPPVPTQPPAVAATAALIDEKSHPEPPPIEALVQQAALQGLAAMVSLSKERPSEPAVHAELAFAYAIEKKYLEAVDAAKVALALNPGLHEDPRVAGALFRAAQSQGASAATFRLLGGAMGSAGADIAYDLAHTEQIKPWVKGQALTFLNGAEARAIASPGLLLALDLPAAKTCEDRAALVRRAILVGDDRALPELTRMKQNVGCGRNRQEDCFPCLRSNDDLDLAITTIARRKSLPPGTKASPTEMTNP